MAAQGDEGRSWVVPLTGLFAECAREMAVGRAEEEFTKLGVQYYAAARSSAWSGLWVCGNLYHHSIEMFLKAGLARRFSLEELHKKFNHRLNAIWNAFQTDFPSPTLTEFNRLIADLARFEDIRYPDKLLKHGVEIRIDYRAAPTPKGRSSRPEPVYRLDFYEMDRLIGAIFAVSSLNPFFFTTGLKPDVQEMLRRDNPAAAQLLPPR